MSNKEIVVVGSLNLDLVATVPRNPAPGETISGTSFQRFTGGKGANQAVAAAQSGGSVAMIGRHGTDGFEVELLHALRSRGVDVSGITPANGSSGIAMILVTESGQNSIVVIPGSNGRLSAENIRQGHQRIASAGIVLAQLETPLDCLEETLRIACAAGVPVIVDPAPVQSLDPALVRQISWLTPNETEAAFLCGAPVPPVEEMRPFAERFLAMGVRNLLLKLGERGAYLATEDGLREHIPGHAVKMVDSTGAGDALNGALATALMEGCDPVEAARFSVAAAAISVTRRGAIPSLATRPEIDMFMLQRAPV